MSLYLDNDVFGHEQPLLDDTDMKFEDGSVNNFDNLSQRESSSNSSARDSGELEPEAEILNR
tara:strand:- start:3479 stop:3664 length:186 start_codon:yes stop_codon:yes gene_type:complete